MGCVLSTVFGIIIDFLWGCIEGKILRYWVVSAGGVMGGDLDNAKNQGVDLFVGGQLSLCGWRPSFFAPIGGVRSEAGW